MVLGLCQQETFTCILKLIKQPRAILLCGCIQFLSFPRLSQSIEIYCKAKQFHFFNRSLLLSSSEMNKWKIHINYVHLMEIQLQIWTKQFLIEKKNTTKQKRAGKSECRREKIELNFSLAQAWPLKFLFCTFYCM